MPAIFSLHTYYTDSRQSLIAVSLNPLCNLSQSESSYHVAELNVPELRDDILDVSANVFYQCFDADGREVCTYGASNLF